jgi:hypothetical protein
MAVSAEGSLYAARVDRSLRVPGVGVLTDPSELPRVDVLERTAREEMDNAVRARTAVTTALLDAHREAYEARVKELERSTEAEARSMPAERLLELLRASYSAAESSAVPVAPAAVEESGAAAVEALERVDAARSALFQARLELAEAERVWARAADELDDAFIGIEQAREAEELEGLRKQWAVDRASKDPRLMLRLVELMAGVRADPSASSSAMPGEEEMGLQGGPAGPPT